jgi:hypothetical protein
VHARRFFPVAMSVLLCVSIAHADDRAAQLKAAGDAAMDSLRYDEALADYKQAYELSHDVAILYNLGQLHRARGEYPEALDSLLAFDKAAPPSLHARVPKLNELIDEVRAKVATLTITANVSGARVLLRDKVIGTTPLADSVRLGAGKVTLEIDADGYAPYRKELDLAGGTSTVLDAKLEPKDVRGILVVHANAGAIVIIDGKTAGTTPVEVPVQPGTHSVLVKREGFLDNASSAVVQTGERHEIDVTLAHTTPIYAKWWFWTGIGVIVAAGVGITLAAVLPRAPDTGDGFQPGQLGAPLRW